MHDRTSDKRIRVEFSKRSFSCSAVHMVGSVFNMDDLGSERDTESEDSNFAQKRRTLTENV